jgi:DNA-binding transcriptional LysR family regulator
VSAPNFLVVPDLVADTDLVAALPERLARRAASRLDIFELPFSVGGFRLIAAWHPRHQADPGHSWLRQTIADLA